MKRTKYFLGGAAALSVLLLAGCASYEARKDLENVAKGWCETIRASQVIPVYPLTEDLAVGDVFLVRTPISQQASEYETHGFLPLDDAVVRLPYTNFSSIYFNGYWKDEFGATPHPSLSFTNAAGLTNGQWVELTAAPIPRAAFPSYSFKAQSGFGVNLALPIEGIPVALSYLNSQQVDGSVAISDARTYAGDLGELIALVRTWAAKDDAKQLLMDTARGVAPQPVFLRVVSRVYYARAIEVALHRSGSQGGGAKAGVVNEVSLLSTNGDVGTNYSNLLSLLTAQAASAVGSAAQAGGAVKFISASDSTIGLSQTFDRLLAVGYLGFDLPFDTNGFIGSPIPTFQRLKLQVQAPLHPNFAPPSATADSMARQDALFAKLHAMDDAKARTVVSALGFSSDAKTTLQNKIAHAQTDAEFRALEDAFKTAQ